MSWRDYWNGESPVYVSERHKILHYQRIARDIFALLPSPDSHVLDYASGEALEAARVAAHCERLYLCDGAPRIRDFLEKRYADIASIVILAPEEMDRIEPQTLDLVVCSSLLQYITQEECRALLAVWHAKLKPGGKLVVADVIPTDATALDDAKALLRFGFEGGFLIKALLGLIRTAVSDYRRLRQTYGLTRYREVEFNTLLQETGFTKINRITNLGPNPARMTFEAFRL